MDQPCGPMTDATATSIDARPRDPHPLFAPEALPGPACLGEAVDVRLRPPKGRKDGGSRQSLDPRRLAEWPQVAPAPVRLCRVPRSTRRRISSGPTSSSTRRTSPAPATSRGNWPVCCPTGRSSSFMAGRRPTSACEGCISTASFLDEYPLLNPAVFGTVVRPCLADYGGFALVSGTSNGDDHFNHLRLRTESDPRWDQFIIPFSPRPGRRR